MSDRRSFFKKLVGATLAPFLPIPASESNISIGVKPRKLNVRWSMELEQDLMICHGIDLQAELEQALAKEMQREIDEHFIGELV